MVSSVLCDILRRLGYGIKLKSAITKEVTELAGFGYVDDTDLVETNMSDDTINDVAVKLQESIDWWEIGANASGGMLVTSIKFRDCSLILLGQVEYEYTTNFEMDSLEIEEVNGKKIEIDMQSPIEAKKMLYYIY